MKISVTGLLNGCTGAGLGLLMVSMLLSSPVIAEDGALMVDGARIEKNITALSAFGRNADGGVDRVAFSDADIQAREFIAGLMKDAGLQVRIDAAGNLIGRRDGSEDLKPIMIGSHIDSVPGGGNYDGDVGVIGSIEVARVLHDSPTPMRHPLEVVVFADEEGVLTGSRAMIGKMTPESLATTSHSGFTVAEGISQIGGNPARIDEAVRAPCSIAAFVELHIEQGAVLFDEKIDIGVVTGIVGIRWWDVVVEGVANHAGTTPMDKRVDPMLASADFINLVNEAIRAEPGTQVGTVGRIRAEPGAPNVIPDRVILSLEIRDLDAGKIQRLFERIRFESREIARRHGTPFEFREIAAAATPAPTDERIRNVVARSAEKLGLSFREMPSGAGHDAQNMARISPTGMIFVPSVNGISHSPREFTRPEDMANGAEVLLNTVLALDESPPECSPHEGSVH